MKYLKISWISLILATILSIVAFPVWPFQIISFCSYNLPGGAVSGLATCFNFINLVLNVLIRIPIFYLINSFFKTTKSRIIFTAVTALLIITAFFGYYYYNQLNHTKLYPSQEVSPRPTK